MRFCRKEDTSMADRIELSELETYLYHSADILRTHVDASDYKMYVF